MLRRMFSSLLLFSSIFALHAADTWGGIKPRGYLGRALKNKDYDRIEIPHNEDLTIVNVTKFCENSKPELKGQKFKFLFNGVSIQTDAEMAEKLQLSSYDKPIRIVPVPKS